MRRRLAFPAGALLGACCTHATGDRTAYVIAGLVACAAGVMWDVPDPISGLGAGMTA